MEPQDGARGPQETWFSNGDGGPRHIRGTANGDSGNGALSFLAVRGVAAVAAVQTQRVAVARFAAEQGASEAVVTDIALAVSEACTNVVTHAYLHEPEPGAMIVEAWREGDQLAVLVRDEGRGMIPRADSPGLGLGMCVMARLAERMEVVDEQPDPGTTVRMWFSLQRQRVLDPAEELDATG